MTRFRYVTVAALLLIGVASGCTGFTSSNGNCNGNGGGGLFGFNCFRNRNQQCCPPMSPCGCDTAYSFPMSGAAMGGYPMGGMMMGEGPTCLGENCGGQPGPVPIYPGMIPQTGMPPLAPAPRVSPLAQPETAGPVSRSK